MIDQTCDVCGRERETQVGASPLGPVSLAYCDECLERGAMDLTAIRCLFDSPQDLTEDLREYGTTWKDGQYMSLEEALS